MNTPNRPLHWFAVLTAIATFLLLGLGGLVTSHEAGMSVPDWPTSYGYNMFALPIKFWTGGAFFEHTHRLLASVVGLMTTILALWIFGRNSRPVLRWAGLVLPVVGLVSEILFPNRWVDGVLDVVVGVVSYLASYFWPRCERSPKWMCWLGVIAFFGVVAQGILGGLRVRWHMDYLGIPHGVIAQSFLILICAIAFFTSGTWAKIVAGQKSTPVLRRFRNHVLYVTLLIFAQLILGATMRHQHAGLAISDFPLAHHQLWPDTNPAAIARYNAERMETTNINPITAFQVVLQMVHRLVALLIFLGVASTAWLAWKRFGKQDSLTKLALFWTALIVAQIGLGAWTIWSNKAADIATAHVLAGALSLVIGSFWCFIAFNRPSVAPVYDRRSPGAAAVGALGTLAANK
jgi:heme a synthase